jgi:hypothetical protein
MSIPGWETLGPNDPTKYKATIPGITKTGSGGVVTPNQSLRTITNKATGNFDVYEPNIFGDKLIYSYNASNNKVIEVDKDKFKQYFSGAKGEAQLKNTNTQIKTSTLKIAEKDAGPNPTPNIKKELEDLKKSPGYKSEANKATQPEAGTNTTPAADKTTPAAGTKIEGLKVRDAVGEKSGTRNQFPILKYPVNLKSESQDVIKFNMVKYEPKKFESEKLEFEKRTTAGEKDRKIIGIVTLQIPAGISDMNACNWGGGETMNAAEAGSQSIAGAAISGGGAGASAELTKLVEGISGNNEGVKAAILAKFAESASSTSGFLQRTSGLLVNSNLELLFGGPTLRPFSFTFKMSAREKDEAEEIRSIIRFFKQGMSAIRSKSSLFLKTPHTFQIQYFHKGKEHKFLNKFKECALTSFSVNYTPHGEYATYTDGAMVSYEMQMQFTELEPIFNDEYPEDNDASIGF